MQLLSRGTPTAYRPAEPCPSQCPEQKHQIDDFSAATGRAFTTVLAGLAFTTTSLPNIILLPALVAGFFLVLIMQSPGMVNLPVLSTSLAAKPARVSNILEASDFLMSCAVARASAMPPFGIDFTAFMAFIAFIGAILKKICLR